MYKEILNVIICLLLVESFLNTIISCNVEARSIVHSPSFLEIANFPHSLEISSLEKSLISSLDDTTAAHEKIVAFVRESLSKRDVIERSFFLPEVNYTSMNDIEKDELNPPKYVKEQEEWQANVSQSKFNMAAQIKSKFNRQTGNSQDTKAHLPTNLKVRVKVAYDQSFHNLMSTYNISPAYALWYLTELVKQIFALPGLQTKIKLEISSGKFFMRQFNLSN